MAAVVGVDTSVDTEPERAIAWAQETLARRQRERQEKAEHERERRLFERRRVGAIMDAMPRETRIEYELEGCLPLSQPLVAIDEDLDPTPPPTGCPRCWEHTVGSSPCQTCPNANAKREQAAYVRQQRSLGVKPVVLR